MGEYWIQGEDGEEYGPVSVDSLRNWVSEDRVGVGSQVKLVGEGTSWKDWEEIEELRNLISQEPPRPAPLGRRFLAFVFDYVLLFFVLSVATMKVFGDAPFFEPQVLERLMLNTRNPDFRGFWDSFNLMYEVALIAIQLLYFIYCHGRWGSSFGKKIFGLKVVRSNGDPLTWRTAIIRGVGTIFSMNLFGFGYLIAVLNPERRTLHDWLAGTIVVSSRNPKG